MLNLKSEFDFIVFNFNNLKNFRRSRRLTISQLAAVCGIPANRLSRFERGKCSLNDNEVSVLTQTFNCTPAELLARTSVH